MPCLFGIWGFFVLTGLTGVDFGGHWDEWYQANGLDECLNRMTLVTPRYIYNGLYFSLGLLVVLAHLRRQVPGIVRAVLEGTPTTEPDLNAFAEVKQFQKDGHDFTASLPYVLQTRGVFLVLSSLTILFVYLACRRLYPSRPGAALAGAAFLAFSWEFQYHARWIAIDAPLACFVALEFALLCCALRASDRRRMTWFLVGGALAAGCALGCKATGVFAVIPLLLVPWTIAALPMRTRWALLAVCGVTFLGAAFITSPGPFLDPLRALATLRYASVDYNRAGDYHTNVVSGFPEHAARLLLWLTAAVPSTSLARAVPMSAVAVLGAVLFCRRQPRIAIPWVVFLAIMLAFMARNHLLIVRQYLLFVPLMAVAFGFGVACLTDWLKTAPAARGLLAVATAVVLVANVHWLYGAVLSLTRVTATEVRTALLADILREKAAIRVSPGVHALLADKLAPAFHCAPVAAGVATTVVPRQVAFKYAEHPLWRCNRLGAFAYTYGPRDANYDWYSAFPGKLREDRLLKVPSDFAESIKLNTATFHDCVPR